MLKTTMVGNYPKITEDKTQANLRLALNKFDQKEITLAELEKVYQETTKRVIKEEEEAGLDILTDGQIRWDDLVTPFAKNINGFEIDGLLRFFDNNVYYRRPVVKSKLSFRNYSVVEEFKFVQKNSSLKVKPVVVGALTLAKLSLDEFYNDEEKLILELAEILHKEALRLDRENAEIIQIDEPSLYYNPDDIDLVEKSLRIITPGLKAKIALYLYFGSIKDLVPKLFDLPVDIIGIDIISKPENFRLILDYNGEKEIGLGCVDARNTKMETESELFAFFEKITQRIPSDKIYINPSCGLEFLPHADAFKKLKNMVSAVKKFNGFT
jgi:5-methyltetrahydropteroyltriglutamate--homocysteine methyltransferase